MSRSIVRICFALVFAAALVLPRPALAQGENEIGIARGSMAEGVVVEDLDGAAFDLADFVGQGPVLLEFWATWCEQCEALLPQFEAAYERYRDRLALFAVAVGVGQSPRSIKRHLRRHPMSYPILFDRRGTAVRAFMAPTTSYVVILDESGVVRYTGVGPDQNIDEAIRGVVGGR